ncbi:MAG: hypothetical protein ABEH43_07545, partial [Flavobacteriales bacterium]
MLKAWFIMFLAGGFVLIFPAIQENSPFLKQQTRSYSFFELKKTDTQTALKDSSILQDTLVTAVDTQFHPTSTMDSSTKDTLIDSAANSSPKSSKELLSPFFKTLKRLEKKEKDKASILWF